MRLLIGTFLILTLPLTAFSAEWLAFAGQGSRWGYWRVEGDT